MVGRHVRAGLYRQHLTCSLCHNQAPVSASLGKFQLATTPETHCACSGQCFFCGDRSDMFGYVSGADVSWSTSSSRGLPEISCFSFLQKANSRTIVLVPPWMGSSQCRTFYCCRMSGMDLGRFGDKATSTPWVLNMLSCVNVESEEASGRQRCHPWIFGRGTMVPPQFVNRQPSIQTCTSCSPSRSTV